MSFTLASADELDVETLHRFFRRVFTAAKADFLLAHDDWLLKSRANRLVVLDAHGEVVASSALIPARCLIGGQDQPAAWRADLVVLPEYRGRGLQRVLDGEMQERCSLLLGFPNPLATQIHRRHGWEVRYGLVMLLPLRPSGLRALNRLSGLTRHLTRGAGRVLDPVAALATRTHHRSPNIVRVPFDAELFARLFATTCSSSVATTARTVEHFEWRFQQAPFRDQFGYYTAHSNGRVSQLLISRMMSSEQSRMFRILDLFGDLDDVGLLRQLISTAVVDAHQAECDQVTAAAFRPGVQTVLTRAGFLLRSKVRFCWQTKDPTLRETLHHCELDWTLADSDNDEVM